MCAAARDFRAGVRISLAASQRKKRRPARPAPENQQFATNAWSDPALVPIVQSTLTNGTDNAPASIHFRVVASNRGVH